MKKALITGITGQDGSYLAELLLDKGYEVHGIKRRSSSFNTKRIDHLYQHPHTKGQTFFIHYGDLADSSNLIRILNDIKPDEIYNLGAMSHVKVSFEIPEYTANIDGLGTLRILEAVRILKMEKSVKIYQASTSELYGLVQEIPQNENTPFHPRSPYGVAKLYSFWIAKNYRESYGMFVSNGILFNHESPLRGETFVTKKITRGVARIVLGKEKVLYLGNINAKRDWGHAKDYVKMMWLILQHDNPEDWVIATGKTTSVRDFVIKSFKSVGIIIKFHNKGINEIGVVERILNNIYSKNIKIGDILIRIDPNYYRPSEVDLLVGDSSKAKKLLEWEPEYTLEQLIDEMVQFDLLNEKNKI